MRLKSGGSFRQTGVAMINKRFATILTLPLVAGVLSAQSPKTQALLMAMGANGKQIASYQWKERITVVRRGIPSATILEELRFDATGQLQRITLSKPEEKRMGPLRARKAAEIKDSVQEVMQLAGRMRTLSSLARQSGKVRSGKDRARFAFRRDP